MLKNSSISPYIAYEIGQFEVAEMSKGSQLAIALAVIAIVSIMGYVLLGSSKVQTTETSYKTDTNIGNPTEKVKLLGSGATFPYPQLISWMDDFHKEYSNIIINYNPVGSGTGQNQFFGRVVDFAGSDPPVSKAKWQEWKGKFVQMPYILGAVVISYNLPNIGSKELKLDGETIALIYKGEIQYWDDPKIASLNPGIKLPHRRIIAIHRSDSSGTTNIFTLFLYKAAPNIWPEDLVGKSIEWPVDKRGNGVGGKGNPGVAEILSSTKNSLGYVELAYAIEKKMPVALIKNKESKFVRPTTETITNAAAGALKSLPNSPLDDFSNDLDAVVYAPGENSYPIASFSHLLFYTKYNDLSKLKAIKGFIRYVNTEGQNKIVPGYAPIPKQLREINLKAIDIIKGP